MLLFIVVCWLYVIDVCLCHPDPNPAINAKCENLDNVTFFSYHIHVLFWQQNNISTTNAFQLKEEFIKAFDVNTSLECNDINSTHNENPPLCIVDIDYPEPACPFLTSEWAAFVPPEWFQKTIPWIMLHQSKYEDVLDVMVHPNSGCEIYDHRDWPFWIGNKWDLDLSCLHWDAPGYNYYDCINKAQLLMFDNNEMNYNTYCALSIDNTTNMFKESNNKDFCSTLCQSWIDKLLQFAIDCPHDCDFWTQNQNENQLCKVYANSFDELYNWSIYQCGQ